MALFFVKNAVLTFPFFSNFKILSAKEQIIPDKIQGYPTYSPGKKQLPAELLFTKTAEKLDVPYPTFRIRTLMWGSPSRSVTSVLYE